MRKFNPRYLYTAAATAAITAAVIAIPAWAASGGGDSTAQTPATSAAPGPPPFAYGLTRANAPSAAEIKQSRAKLDEFASCLKDHGIDVPTPGSTAQAAQAPQPPSSSEEQKITKDCGTPPAPPAGLPPLGQKQMEAARKAMTKGDCPRPPALPAPSGK
jgi:hypothetical protein